MQMNSTHRFNSQPTDAFAPFTISSNQRRKRRDFFSKWSTRGILLSPLLIVFLWSLLIIFSGTKKLHRRQANESSEIALRSPRKKTTNSVNSDKLRVSTQFASHDISAQQHNQKNTDSIGKSIILPVDQYLSNKDSKSFVIRPRPHPKGLIDDKNLKVIQQSAVQAETLHINPSNVSIPDGPRSTTGNHEGKLLPIYSPLGKANGYQSSEAISNQHEGSRTNSYFMQSETITEPLSRTEIISGRYIPVKVTDMIANDVVASLNESFTTEVNTSPQSVASSEILHERKKIDVTSDEIMLPVQGSLGSRDVNVIIRPRPKPKEADPKTTIFYYDAETVVVNGQVLLPQVVFDEDGNQFDFQAIQAASNAEIIMEVPSHGSSLMSKGTPAKRLNRQDLERYVAEPPVQDQYIIIATVAVMALMVGALSARRMRSRNFLSSCIENEALEEEVAYDVATTNGDYSTFANNNIFRGDMEKFDV
jgi:hypothetical protein